MEIIPYDRNRQGSGGRKPKYPWDKWLVPGCTVRLTRGEDYDVQSEVLRQQAHPAAKRRGGSVETSVAPDGNSVSLTFWPAGGVEVEVPRGPSDFDGDDRPIGQWGPAVTKEFEDDLYPQG